jgi:hypothetical protein
MARRIWNVSVENVDHTIEIRHSYLSGKKSLFLDGKQVLQTNEDIIRFKLDLRFAIGTHPCFVRIKPNGITYDYELVVDGISTQTGLLCSDETTSGKGSAVSPEQEKLEKQLTSGANWFVLIGMFSLINSLVHLAFDSSLTFVIGLGISQMLDGIGAAFGEKGKWVAGIINYIITFAFMALAIASKKKRNWAYLTGMILYGLDCLILFAFEDYLGIAFHIFVLFWVYIGWRALHKLKKLEEQAVLQVKNESFHS